MPGQLDATKLKELAQALIDVFLAVNQ